MVKGGLKLKREVAPNISLPSSGPFTVAHVWVDAHVFHLDEPFSYLIPEKFGEEISVGSLVLVPFHGREIIGCVIALDSPQSTTGLKFISKVIGKFPLLAPQIITLIKDAAARYAAHPFDLIRSAIPDAIAKVEREFDVFLAPQEDSTVSGVRQYLQLPPARQRASLMANKVKSLLKNGGVLVLLPDSREVEGLKTELITLGITPTVLDSSLPKSEYFSNFLQVRLGRSNVVIGTRSAIFAPVTGLASIVIYNEGSENYYEQRTPGWNVRDIALLRRHNEKIDLFFVGYSPSSEVGRLIEEGWIDFTRARSKVKVSTYPQHQGELLPSRAIPPIKKALASGPILFLVPSKGYAQAIRCSQCKTISRCECGGAHQKKSANAFITCSHCAKTIEHWKCQWCHGVVASLAGRGLDRHHQEIGLLFPGVVTHLSSADHMITDEISSGFVFATPGMAPMTSQGYSAVVILEGNRFLNQPDMRASERVRELYFAHASLVSRDGLIILIQDEGHPIATALATWNPVIALQRDLDERKSLSLPPFVRTALLSMEPHEITRLKSALNGAREEGRLPESTKILGPIPSNDSFSIIVTSDISDGGQLVSMIHEFMRRRSAAKKTLPSLRIDPYSLSR